MLKTNLENLALKNESTLEETNKNIELLIKTTEQITELKIDLQYYCESHIPLKNGCVKNNDDFKY
jgi:hypothetical protein